jgi:AcrR family transcriptional regulator
VYIAHFHVYNAHMTRDRIFAAAKFVLEQEGISGVTTRKVAQSAQMSTMAMYRHFADKDALLNALMEDGLQAWEERARAIRKSDPMEWLEKLGEAYLDFAITEPHRFDAAFFLPAPEARRFPDDFAAGRSPVLAMAMQHIEHARADGRIGDTPALEIALTLAALGQGFVSMRRANRFSSEEQFRALYLTSLRRCLASFTSAWGER